MILRLALPLLLCAAGTAAAQVNPADSLRKRDSAVQERVAPVRRPPDPQLGEKLGRIDADIRDAKSPEERERLQAERARLLQESTGEEMTIQTGPMGIEAPPTLGSQTTPENSGGVEGSEPEVYAVTPTDLPPASTSTASTRYTALPSRTAQARATSAPASSRSKVRTAAPLRRTPTAVVVRSTPSRQTPRAVERQGVQEGGGAVDRASAMARRGQRTEARRTLIDYLRRNPRSPQAIEARKLLQTL